MTTYDAVIIGGGHNGLVCGAYLAKAGQKVLVLERRALIGGACVTEELWPGYHVSTASHMLGMMQPRVVVDLELEKFGYGAIATPPGVHLIEGVGPVVLWQDATKLQAEFARFSTRDAENYPKFQAHLAKVAPHFQRLLWQVPPDPAKPGLRSLVGLARTAFANRGLLPAFHDVTDLITMSAWDYLARWFESPEVMAILGYYPAAAAGQSNSIHDPGTVYFLLRNHLREPGFGPAGGTGLARGGMGSVTQAIAASGRRYGLEIRENAEVEEVLIEGARASGVRLVGGETIRARSVISNAATQHLFGDLVPESAAPAPFRREVTAIHSQSTAFKIHLAVDTPPPFTGLQKAGYPHDAPVQVTLAPSLDYIERAYHEMKLGQLSSRPYMTVQCPTLIDPSLAPKGKHLLSLYGGHVPPVAKGETRGENFREALFQRVLDTISAHAPGWDRVWHHRQILLAEDYEEIFRLPGGSPHHGDLTPDQLFFRRPIRGFADYRTPVAGLYLCGASAHPGGGVTGVPGYNAARVVGRDLGARL